MLTVPTLTRATMSNREKIRVRSKVSKKTRGQSHSIRLNFNSRLRLSVLIDREEFKEISQVIYHQLITKVGQDREMR